MRPLISSKGRILICFVVALVALLSFRQLSDPDTGTHLKGGKWITENNRFPDKDVFTYTCNTHDYIDTYWLFQVISFGIFNLTGYRGLSVFVMILSLFLLYLVILRVRSFGLHWLSAAFILSAGFLCIETRIALRPEMFSFIFLTLILLVLDKYYKDKRRKLQLLPLVMLLWCNMHGLFILGLFVMGIYFISIWMRDKKPDYRLFLWVAISFLICFVNPYSYKLLIYSFMLATRFSADNIFHGHIRELASFSETGHYFFRDYLFLCFSGISFLFILLTLKNRKIHEVLLLISFFILAWMGVRNTGLFSVVAMPVFCISARDAWEIIRKKIPGIQEKIGFRIFSFIFFILMLLFIIGTGMRVSTNAYYHDNNSYAKTGIGSDEYHLPLKAAGFLNYNHLDGRVINSLSLGGWLSWTTSRPVFLDGRLEVMGEELYKEVVNSWSGGLSAMIEKYEPSLIVYNYSQYYPWTLQLARIGSWRPVYLDGYVVIFAKNDYRPEVPGIDPGLYCAASGPGQPADSETRINGIYPGWWAAFIKGPDYKAIEKQQMQQFCMQFYYKPGRADNEDAILSFNEGNRRYQSGDINGAIKSYQQAIKLNPSYYKAWNNLGIVQATELKNYRDALDKFSKAIIINPSLPDAWLSRGTCWFALKDPVKACADWKQAQSRGSVQAGRLIERNCK